ncbi:glycosyltransferase family 61 protein [uncultured Paracoccus sp.]|uniref:glycosyltransferase family 61 protein n=1 Tax=uncultured Paracoccus sp. TaxID=189685 RepID=UPI0025DC6865|nr:glycosyltransferase family 61 protein [uncultured Paracoccus sp.]
MSEPLPGSGWSREIVTVKNAWVFPPTALVQRPFCGVTTAEGQDVLHASTWRNGIRMTRPVEDAAMPPQFLPGRHLWGGLYYGHFGHFMTESMSRCWGFGQSGIDSVLFVPKHDRLLKFQAYQTVFWSLLGIEATERVVQTPIRVEELVIPGQGFGLGRIAAGTPEFRATMARMAQALPQDSPRRIYVSRTRFNGRGGVLCEKVLERNMAEQGYTIMHPERMTLDDQLRFYKSATHIVGVDSSAFHIAGMVADPSKRIAFILRRDNNAHRSIAAQINGMTGQDPIIINTLAANWIEEGSPSSNHLSWGELDHAILAQGLQDHGFIDDKTRWQAPTDQDMADSLALSRSKHAVGLVRRPVAG